MSQPRNHVQFTIELPAEPDAVFSHFTEHFDQIWPGTQRQVRAAPDGSEPMGLGYVRGVKPPGQPELEEEIIRHERPSLIEYKVINDAPISNHLGRISFSPAGTGTRVDYTIDYDFKPAALGIVSRTVLHGAWRAEAARKLRKAFPG